MGETQRSRVIESIQSVSDEGEFQCCNVAQKINALFLRRLFIEATARND